MLVQIVLDRSNAEYTNHDIISGRVLLHVLEDTNVSSVVVKLEGESRTRLAPPSGPSKHDNKQRPARETHKLLYKVLSLDKRSVQ